jgi:lipid II:glycine glycyltransferase (peptidoglycan interpeptide bridge formation enzyme)
VEESAHGTYGHTWEWKRTLEEGLNVKSLCLVAEENGDLVGVYPAFLYAKYKRDESLGLVKCFLAGNAQVLWSPLFLTWDYGGPCLRPGAPSTIQAELISQMEKVAKKHRAMDVWLSPYKDEDLQRLLSEDGYKVTERFTSLIDLTQSEDDLWKNLKGETRSQVRQGKKLGLEAREVTDRKGLEAFYTCLSSVAGRTDMTLPPKAFFDVLFDIFVPVKMMRIYEVTNGDQSIGNALFLYHKGTIVARYWAAYQESLKLRPYHVLIWHILIEAKQMGFQTCDLGGMPPDPENGIYKFKKGWGVRIEHVDWYVKAIRHARTRNLAKRAVARLQPHS